MTDLTPAEALARRFSALASALGVDVDAAKAAALGDDAAVLRVFAEIGGQDAKVAVEILMAGVSSVIPLATSGMSDARRANTLRLLAVRLLAQADALHPRQGEDG